MGSVTILSNFPHIEGIVLSTDGNIYDVAKRANSIDLDGIAENNKTNEAQGCLFMERFCNGVTGRDSQGCIKVGYLLSMEPWAAAKKNFQLVWWCHQLLSEFLAKGPLPPVMSVANDKGDNEMILGAVHRSLGICHTAKENPRNPQLGDHLMKRMCDQSSPQTGSLSST